MRTFKEDIARAVNFHGHLCSGQCIGVKMAHMAMRLLGLDNETDGKKLMVFVECNRCPSDAIMISTGCRVGKRTYYFHDLGRVAASFLNLETGKAVRIYRKKHVYPPDGASNGEMIDFYDALPEEDFLEAQEVSIELGDGDLPGPPVEVVVCQSCGEEVMDKRHVNVDGRCLCRACAGNSYYSFIK